MDQIKPIQIPNINNAPIIAKITNNTPVSSTSISASCSIFIIFDQCLGFPANLKLREL